MAPLPLTWRNLTPEAGQINRLFSNLGIDRAHTRRSLRRIVGKGAYDWTGKKVVHRNQILKRVFSRAAKTAGKFNASSVTSLHLLQALCESPTSLMVRLFASLNITGEQIKQKAGQFCSRNDFSPGFDNSLPNDKADSSPSPNQSTNLLSRIGRDLTALAKEGRLDPVVGRRDELLQLVRILTRKTKSNPVLVGEAGVGKTAVVEALAMRIASGNITPALWGHRIVEIRIGALMAGTKYRGDLEDRLNRIIETAQTDSKLILLLDELHALVGTGNASGGTNVADILKPVLARGAMRCIGATTFDEYHRHIEKDPALSRRFIKLTINEPSQIEALEILKGLRPGFEAHHNARILDDAP